jgi:hypothetical protein
MMVNAYTSLTPPFPVPAFDKLLVLVVRNPKRPMPLTKLLPTASTAPRGASKLGLWAWSS